LLLVFQQFPLVSPLANALAVPLISFVVTPLALLAAPVPWSPILALAHAVLDGLMHFLVWCAAWPVWQAPAPPAWAVAAGGLGVAVCLLPRGVPGRGLGVALLLPAMFWPPPAIPDGEARIDVLDVGDGQAVVVRTRSHLLIYDPGPQYGADSDAGQRVVVPYLRWLGAGAIDRLVVTHADKDHAGGLASLQAALPVGGLLSSMPELAGELCVAGQRWTWDGVEFAILHPLPEAYAARPDNNHLSCVLTVTVAGHRALLTADIEASDEAALVARDPAGLAAAVIVVPHHGSKTSSTAAFVDAVAAKHALFSVGYRNRFGHPRDDVTRRYADGGAQLWRTDRDGALQVVLGADGVRLSAWRDERRRYWHGR
jgi:competence protein ComEC